MQALTKNRIQNQIVDLMFLPTEQLKEMSKEIRRGETDVIRDKLIPLAIAQESTNPQQLFMVISRYVRCGLFQINTDQLKPKDLKQLTKFLTHEQLAYWTLCNRLVAELIHEEVQQGAYYKDINQKVKELVTRFAEHVGVTTVPGGKKLERKALCLSA